MQRKSALHPEKKKQRKRKIINKEKEIYVNKWQLSDSDSTINDLEDSRQPGNKQVQRSSDFFVALKNAKSSTMNLLIDLDQVTDTSRWFELSRSKFPWENIQCRNQRDCKLHMRVF